MFTVGPLARGAGDGRLGRFGVFCKNPGPRGSIGPWVKSRKFGALDESF